MSHSYPALIDLHLHLDGSLSLANVRTLAAMQNIALPQDDHALLAMLQVEPGCRDLNEYLEKFAFPCSLLQTEEALSVAVCLLAEELRQEGLLYAEIRFAPQLHTEMGLTQEQVVEAAARGLRRSGFAANLILCCMRGQDNRVANGETIRTAAAFLGRGVCAVDLAGAEALFPTADIAHLFELAQSLGVPYTIHAGEADGPESIRAALAMGAKRIGHGIRSVEDAQLVALLARSGVPLELCPTSNLHTCVFPAMKDYPLRRLLDAGVQATVNTDNRTVSGTTLRQEMDALESAVELTRAEALTLTKNAARVAFLGDKEKNALLAQVEQRYAM